MILALQNEITSAIQKQHTDRRSMWIKVYQFYCCKNGLYFYTFFIRGHTLYYIITIHICDVANFRLTTILWHKKRGKEQFCLRAQIIFGTIKLIKLCEKHTNKYL